jgi:hypothetical protein
MTEIDLNLIGVSPQHRWEAIGWLISNYGLSQADTWYMIGLDTVCFNNPKHATHFILKWS